MTFDNSGLLPLLPETHVLQLFDSHGAVVNMRFCKIMYGTGCLHFVPKYLVSGLLLYDYVC